MTPPPISTEAATVYIRVLVHTVDMDKVEEVAIEPDGVFKYILIELTEKVKKGKNDGPDAGSKRKMTIVRGFQWAEFHGKLCALHHSTCRCGLICDCSCMHGSMY